MILQASNIHLENRGFVSLQFPIKLPKDCSRSKAFATSYPEVIETGVKLIQILQAKGIFGLVKKLSLVLNNFGWHLFRKIVPRKTFSLKKSYA